MPTEFLTDNGAKQALFNLTVLSAITGIALEPVPLLFETGQFTEITKKFFFSLNHALSVHDHRWGRAVWERWVNRNGTVHLNCPVGDYQLGQRFLNFIANRAVLFAIEENQFAFLRRFFNLQGNVKTARLPLQ